jgi:pimeloyl-ACP methyl ester carboxylesterase
MTSSGERLTPKRVLVLSGMGLDKRVWQALYFDRLRKQGVEPVLIDYRPEWFVSGAETSVEDLTDRCLEEIAPLLHPAPVLLGFSVGALVAQEIALRRGGRLDALILVSPFAHQLAVQKTAMDLEARLLASGPPVSELLAWLDVVQLSSRQELFNEGVFRRRYAASLGRRRDATLDVALFSAVRRYQGDLSKLATIRCPTTIIAFADDFMVPAACSRRVAAAVPHAEYVEIPDAGHAGVASHHGQVLAAVLQACQGPRTREAAAATGLRSS